MVRLKEHKSSTWNKPIERVPSPVRVFLPMVQHLGKACVPQVKPLDRVKVGQKIAMADAHVYSPVHSSVSGTVAEIKDVPHPVLGMSKAIIIDNDGMDEQLNKASGPGTKEQIKGLSPSQIRDIIFESGIVGMGGSGFPTHIKLNPPGKTKDLIINGAECEPYLTGDHRLMVEKPEEILSGIEAIAQCLGAENIHIAIEENKPDAIKAFKAFKGLKVSVLESQYPQGGEKQLIKSVLGKEVPGGKLPFDIGVVVHNVATVFAVYEALYLGKPLYERVVTVSGSCVMSPRNLLVRLGTPIRDVIKYCGILKEEPSKIIIGGPMMGIAQYSDDVPVIKTTTGVLLFNEEEAAVRQEAACIRCGACVRACPASLMPCLINMASLKSLWSKTKDLGAADCIECGCCNFVCPANRNITQSIKRAKLEEGK